VGCLSRIEKKQLFTKKGAKSLQFSKSIQLPPFGKSTDHPLGKSPTFLNLNFFAKRNIQFTIKFDMDLEVPFIYRLIPRKSGYREPIVFFEYHSSQSLFGSFF
jgi:hypothetical protein